MCWTNEVLFPAGAGGFVPRHRFNTGCGTHPAFFPVRTGGPFPRVNRPGRKADHLIPSSTEVKNAWSYTSTSPVRLHDVLLS
jgi:hypothetical protein